MNFSSTNEILCHVSASLNIVGDSLISLAEKASIRKNVCLGPSCYRVKGNKYCLLHAPIKDKSYAVFESAVIEKIERQQADFRAVWFPHDFDINHYDFKDLVDFSYAHFDAGCYFRVVNFCEQSFFLNTTFTGNAAFQHCNFKSTAYFNESAFDSDTSFRFAHFEDGCLFWESAFLRLADFQGTHFKRLADFSGVNFTEFADFSHAAFDDAIYLKPLNLSENARIIIK